MKNISKKKCYNFSVLMSLYKNSLEFEFIQCVNSIINQKILPNEIVIVYDGPLNFTPNLKIFEYHKAINVLTVKLLKNGGLANALNQGFSKITNELVFRVDTDDILHENRFFKQYNYMIDNPSIDVLGSNMAYIDSSGSLVDRLRIVPEENLSIRRLLLLKNPLNHPTVVYKKSVIEAVNLYSDIFLYEDWFLWWKLSKDKTINFHNLKDELVFYRIDSVFDRRGFKFIPAEYNFYFSLLKNSYINFVQFIIAIFLKLPVRVFPKKLYNIIKNNYDKIT
tara:strand:+ start:1834 stop:2670 length:837 start_codon:yes stop_codon:yes gene_type:complete